MNESGKIYPQHLERMAYVYIRQSTLRQVAENLESHALQYQLGQHAQTLGWPKAQVVVIDEDLGKSAITAENRSGFQALVSAVGLAQVGIILVTDVSRLARNCSDWYQLLDLASLCGSLIGDASGIYDPRDFNDRLLLGLKGTFSEAQWYHLRMQLHDARLNKARRGELAVQLPVGYERTEEGEVVFLPDQEVQNAIRLVFNEFDRLGSARAVLLALRGQQVQLPRQILTGPDRGTIEWGKPSYNAIYRILKSPAYAGAYTYGKRQNKRLPGKERKVVTRALPIDEWAVLIHDVFPAYISWKQYLHNQDKLRSNAQNTNWGNGAPRSGQALLQGIAWCGRCGRRLKLRYSNQPAYVCEHANQQYGDPRCQSFMVPHIDTAITRIFLEAIQPAHLETAMAALEQVEAHRQQLSQQWQQRLERARYQADLARRRFERVDPDNRLVATELEARWEARLQESQCLEREWAEAQAQQLKSLSEADQGLIRQLATNVPALWHAETTTFAERKRLLRCLIQDVTLDAMSKPGLSIIHIRWHTGTTTVIEAERPRAGCRTAKDTVARIRTLAQCYPDDQIAEILNAEGISTTTGKSWTRRRVGNVRKNYAIVTACPYFTYQPGPRGDGLTKASEAAARLGVSTSMIAYWFQRGLLIGCQRKPQTPIWVRLTDDDFQRLNGSLHLQDDMIAFPEAAAELDLTLEQLQEEIQSRRLLTYRLLIHNRWRWYVKWSTD